MLAPCKSVFHLVNSSLTKQFKFKVHLHTFGRDFNQNKYKLLKSLEKN